MSTENSLLTCLEKTPEILNHLIDQIPEEHISTRRVEGKWSVHEQVCHLVEAQQVLHDRFVIFEKEDFPKIKTYNAGGEVADNHYLKNGFSNLFG